METAYWVGLLSALVALVGILVAIERFNKVQQNNRVACFVQEFRNLKEEKNGGRQDIAALSLSGINSLKNDDEYRQTFERIHDYILHHPLGKWNNEIEKIGYKTFFQWVRKQGRPLTEETIEQLISDYKEK